MFQDSNGQLLTILPISMPMNVMYFGLSNQYYRCWIIWLLPIPILMQILTDTNADPKLHTNTGTDTDTAYQYRYGTGKYIRISSKLYISILCHIDHPLLTCLCNTGQLSLGRCEVNGYGVRQNWIQITSTTYSAIFFEKYGDWLFLVNLY